jgi:antitoxin protein of toxin-antitoxin system
MGIFDKAKEALGEHADKVTEGVAKLGDLADDKTGNQYTEQIDQGENLVTDHLDGTGSRDTPGQA